LLFQDLLRRMISIGGRGEGEVLEYGGEDVLLLVRGGVFQGAWR